VVFLMFLKELIMKPYFDIITNSFLNSGTSFFSLVYNSRVNPNSKVCAWTKFTNSSIGRYSYIGRNCSINNTAIGSYCSVGMNVKTGLGFHPAGFVSTSPVFYKNKNVLGKSYVTEDKFQDYKTINIGNDVWLGADALIIDGVTIGDGAIVGAKTVVTKDIPPYAIVAGVPGKIIKFRFTEEIIEKLLKLQWWDFDIDKNTAVVGELFHQELSDIVVDQVIEKLKKA
jgi:acetyltransferase-like isoleucine patch superfamily enzyme